MINKLIYIAGPFRGPNSWEMEQNIRRAEEVSLEVWKLGAPAICPHCNNRFFQGVCPEETWAAGDLLILERCDAIFMGPKWDRSEGARKEMVHAIMKGLPVFFTIEALKEWLENA